MGTPVPDKKEIVDIIESLGTTLGSTTAALLAKASNTSSGEAKGQLLHVIGTLSNTMTLLASAKTFIQKNHNLRDIYLLDVNIPDASPAGNQNTSDDDSYKYN